MVERDVNKPYSDARWRDDPGACAPICNECKNRGRVLLLDNKSEEISTLPCTAFPDGIPYRMFDYMSIDELPSECNNGIGFVKKDN